MFHRLGNKKMKIQIKKIKHNVRLVLYNKTNYTSRFLKIVTCNKFNNSLYIGDFNTNKNNLAKYEIFCFINNIIQTNSE
jgi:hypothetical protein